MARELLNVLKICEDYKTDGLNFGWLGRKTTKQTEKELLNVHIPYPDIDWCLQTKTYISYDTDNKLLYLSNNLKLGKNYWLQVFIDDVKNNRVNIEKYYHRNWRNNG